MELPLATPPPTTHTQAMENRTSLVYIKTDVAMNGNSFGRFCTRHKNKGSESNTSFSVYFLAREKKDDNSDVLSRHNRAALTPTCGLRTNLLHLYSQETGISSVSDAPAQFFCMAAPSQQSMTLFVRFVHV